MTRLAFTAADMTPRDFRAAREAVGASQRAFAKAMGVSPRAVLRWEQGTVPIPAYAAAFARLLRDVPEACDYALMAGRRIYTPQDLYHTGPEMRRRALPVFGMIRRKKEQEKP